MSILVVLTVEVYLSVKLSLQNKIYWAGYQELALFMKVTYNSAVCLHDKLLVSSFFYWCKLFLTLFSNLLSNSYWILHISSAAL